MSIVGQFKIPKPLLYLFLFFCFFPYLRILPINLDAQPYALILGFFITIFLLPRKLPKSIFILLYIMIIAILLWVAMGMQLVEFRSLMNYFSLFFITTASFLSLKYLNGLPYNLFKNSVYIWGIVGLIQFLFFPKFLTFLSYRGDISSMAYGRGVCSLAVEPSFYAMVIVLFFIINYINFKDYKSFKTLNIILLIQLIITKSATVILFLSLSLIIYFIIRIIKQKKFSTLILFSFGILIVFVLLPYFIDNTDSRLTNVISVLYHSPYLFLTMDYSVNNRFLHSFVPFYGFFDRLGIPNGFNHFAQYLNGLKEDPYFNNILVYNFNEEDRVKSAFSGLIFELGVFGLPFIYLFRLIYIKLNEQRLNGLLMILLIITMMINNMPFTQAILPFTLGNLLYICNSESISLSNPQIAINKL